MLHQQLKIKINIKQYYYYPSKEGLNPKLILLLLSSEKHAAEQVSGINHTTLRDNTLPPASSNWLLDSSDSITKPRKPTCLQKPETETPLQNLTSYPKTKGR